MGLIADLDFEAVIAAAQAEAEARDEREAAARGVSIDALYVSREADAAAEEARARHLAACQSRAERIVAISPALTPEMAQAVTQGALRESPNWPAYSAVRRWLLDPESKPVLVLASGTGVGKTVACAWALAHMGGEYVRAVDLAKRHDPYRQEAEPLIMAPHELLVLDDLGTEPKSATGARDRRFMPALYDLVDQRQGAIRRGTRWQKRRTLITTNIGMGAFKDAAVYGEERIRSRLRQSAQWVSIKGTDGRQA
jgi:hypothetical protein